MCIFYTMDSLDSSVTFHSFIAPGCTRGGKSCVKNEKTQIIFSLLHSGPIMAWSGGKIQKWSVTAPKKVYMGGGGVSSLLTIRQAHTETSYQLPLHVLIARWADEDGVLHEADKAPEGVAFILDLSEQGGHQVRHALAVAHVWIKHCIVEQNPPAETTDVLVLL